MRLPRIFRAPALGSACRASLPELSRVSKRRRPRVEQALSGTLAESLPVNQRDGGFVRDGASD